MVDEDVPPLEDMSALVDRVREIREKTAEKPQKLSAEIHNVESNRVEKKCKKISGSLFFWKINKILCILDKFYIKLNISGEKKFPPDLLRIDMSLLS